MSEDDKFFGLALDEGQQDDLSDERGKTWGITQSCIRGTSYTVVKFQIAIYT